jgi:serpin B
MKQLILSLTALALVGIWSCTKEITGSQEGSTTEFTATDREIIGRNNAFAFDLLREVSTKDTEQNVLISPLSASLALGMLNNGADGSTRKEIQSALGYGTISNTALNSLYLKTDNLMKEADTTTTFETANSIWINNSFPVLTTFKDVNTKFFNAEAINVDMDDPATAATINQWCSDKTHGKITDMIESTSGAIMYLINALYFKGVWTVQFEKENTVDATFTNADGSSRQVPMMQKKLAYQYTQREKCQVIELPYGNQSYSMVIVLPKAGLEVSDIVRDLDVDGWNDILNRLSGTEVKVKLPRFSVEYKRRLNTDLEALGMKSMFQSSLADFSRISPNPLFVNVVDQKATVEVNEEGTEASAVTTVGMYTSALEPGAVIPIPEFTADRPFLYLIREKSSDIIFFAGILRSL